MKKKYLTLLIRVLVSAGLIGYFLLTFVKDQGGFNEAFRQFVHAFSSASLQWLIPAFFLHIVGFSLITLRWKILLKAQDVVSPFGQLFIFYFMASFFNTFLPSTIGGDAVRAIESKRLTGSTSTSFMVVIIERMTGLAALILISATAMLVKISKATEREQNIWIFIFLALVCFLIVIFIAHPKVALKMLKFSKKILPSKIQSLVEKAYKAVEVYYKRPGSLILSLCVSVIFQLNMVIYYFFIAKALYQDPDPVDFLIKVPIMIFLLMVIPAINGLGVRTGSFKGLMKLN